MNQDKSNGAQNNSSNPSPWESPDIYYKKRVYKLQNISYMGLSIMYIALILFTAVFGLALLAYFSANNNILLLILVAIICVTLIVCFFHIGNRYGEYGLEILLGKFFQVKLIRNDYPHIRRALLSNRNLFPEQTLIQTPLPGEANDQTSDQANDPSIDPFDEVLQVQNQNQSQVQNSKNAKKEEL